MQISARGGFKYQTTVDWEDSDSDSTMDTTLMDHKKINYDFIVHMVHYIHRQCPAQEDPNHPACILIFMPGFYEIKRLCDMLEAESSHHIKSKTPVNWHILALHSSLSPNDQSLVFKQPPLGYRKIVVSTNVAETGVTIPDVVYVIDTMKAKELSYNPKRKMKQLLTVTISQANAKQRRGRAGRVQPGIAYHLIHRTRFEQLMEHRPPEMMRLPLEQVYLRFASLTTKERASQLFNELIDAPVAQRVQRAQEMLLVCGAINKEEQLTDIGQIFAHLPVDVGIGKLLIYGIFLSCLDPILTAAAILSLGKFSKSIPSVYHSPFSDIMSLVYLYQAWLNDPSMTFPQEHGINQIKLVQINAVRDQLWKDLRSTGLIDTQIIAANDPRLNNYSKQYIMLSSVFAVSFYPNILIQDDQGLHEHAKSKTIKVHPNSVINLSNGCYTYHSIQIQQGKNEQQVTSVMDLNRVPLSALVCLAGEKIQFDPLTQQIVWDNQVLAIQGSPRTIALLLECRKHLMEDRHNFLQGHPSLYWVNRLASLVQAESQRWK